MIKFLLITIVIACATTVQVECTGSKRLKESCTVKDPEVREDRTITRYQEGPKTYFWTSDGGMYQIEGQEKFVKKVAEIAYASGQPVNMCVSQSTSPYTVKTIEVDNDNSPVPLTSWDWDLEPFESTL